MIFLFLFQGSLGWGVIALTFVIKAVLFPFSYQSTKAQLEQKKLAPLIEKIKKDYPDKKDQAEQLSLLYKEHNTNPLAGCLPLLIQLPVLFGLFYVLRSGAQIIPADIYSFIPTPDAVSTWFLGMNLSEPNIILLIITGVLQFLQIHFSPVMQTPTSSAQNKDDQAAMMTAMMQKTSKFMIPALIIFAGMKLPGALALYWGFSSLLTIIQERIIMKMIPQK
jgi:YidC/Oxa1 family membrane protein insertase